MAGKIGSGGAEGKGAYTGPQVLLVDDEPQILEALTRSIVNRLLHDPTVYLKHRATKSELDTARLLFGLWGDDAAPGSER